MKSKACKSCRQQKTRCDALDRLPGSCARCEAEGIECVYDPYYKRVAKTRRIQATELRPVQSPARLPVVLPSLILKFLPCSSPKSFGGLLIASSDVDKLFASFAEYHHQYLPIPLVSSVEELFKTSPLLFAVICSVSCEDASTKISLRETIQGLIPTILGSSGLNVETVQALLILCLWPSPSRTLIDDPSYTYITLATKIAYQIGLHRPEFVREYNSEQPSRKSNVLVRSCTWLACCAINCWQSTRLGLPCTIQTDFCITSVLENPEIPKSLKDLYQLYQFTNSCDKILGMSAESVSGLLLPTMRLRLVPLYLQQLSSLQAKHLTMDYKMELSVLEARLRLYSFLLHDDMDHPLASEYHRRAEVDAIRLIEIVTPLELKFPPVTIPLAVTYAGFVLLMLLRRGSSKIETIRSHISLCYMLLEKLSEDPDDLIGKGRKILKATESLRDAKRTPSVITRSSAWLLYDTIRINKETQQDSFEQFLTEVGMDPNFNG